MLNKDLKEFYDSDGYIDLDLLGSVCAEKDSPDFRNLGCVAFFYGYKLSVKGKEYFVKYNSSDPQKKDCCEVEVLVSNMAKKLGLNTVEYHMAKQAKCTGLGKTEGEWDYCTISEDCTKDNKYKVVRAGYVFHTRSSFSDFMNERDVMYYNSLLSFKKIIGEYEDGGYKLTKQFGDDLIKLSLFDYITSQADRHQSNYFILIDKSKKELLSVKSLDYECVGSKEIWNESDKYHQGVFNNYINLPPKNKQKLLKMARSNNLKLGITQGGVTPEEYLQQIKNCEWVDYSQINQFVEQIKENSFFSIAYSLEKESGYKANPNFVQFMDKMREERVLELEKVLEHRKGSFFDMEDIEGETSTNTTDNFYSTFTASCSHTIDVELDKEENKNSSHEILGENGGGIEREILYKEKEREGLEKDI